MEGPTLLTPDTSELGVRPGPGIPGLLVGEEHCLNVDRSGRPRPGPSSLEILECDGVVGVGLVILRGPVVSLGAGPDVPGVPDTRLLPPTTLPKDGPHPRGPPPLDPVHLIN